MSTKEASRLKKLKGLDLSKWAASFWLVKRRAAQDGFAYSVLRVDIEAKLAKRFRGYIKAQVQDRAFHLDAYDFSNADPEDVLLTLDADATDFHKIEAAIDAGFDSPRAKQYADLLNALAYVVVFESNGQRLFALRKINTLNNPKKAITRQAPSGRMMRLTIFSARSETSRRSYWRVTRSRSSGCVHDISSERAMAPWPAGNPMSDKAIGSSSTVPAAGSDSPVPIRPSVRASCR